MLTKVEAYGFPVLPLDLPIGEEESPFQVLDIQGLGPVKANINTAQFAQFGVVTGTSKGMRNIVLQFGLNPNWVDQSYESLRQVLYTYFRPQEKIRLRFTSNHMPQVEIEGWVESCEPNLFSQEQQVQVSIVCPKPNFTAAAKAVFTFTSPFIGSGTATPLVIDYKGTEPTGFLLTLQATPTAPSYEGQFRLNPNNEFGEFYFSGQVDSARVTELSTIEGDKFVRVRTVSTGLKRSRLSTVPNGMKWAYLRHGENAFNVAANIGGITAIFTYTEQFGGI